MSAHDNLLQSGLRGYGNLNTAAAHSVPLSDGMRQLEESSRRAEPFDFLATCSKQYSGPVTQRGRSDVHVHG